MTRFTLEILQQPTNNKLLKELMLKSSPFYLEGFAFIEGEDGEGQKIEIKGLVRAERAKPKLSVVNGRYCYD